MTTREQRAAGRRQRRRQGEEPEQSGPPSEARQAARDAATRALAAATVSAVRALAAKAGEETETDPPDETAEADLPEETETVSREETETVSPEPKQFHVERRAPQQEPPRGADAGRVQDVIGAARDHLRALHGGDAESVSGLERTPNGWAVDLEVVEVKRIPESTDVLATYRVELDGGLDLLSYERTGRYHRAQADDRGRA